MARTSKRYLEQVEEKEVKSYLAGVYVRLSNERQEAWREKSQSPKTQVYVCQNYAKQNGIHVVQVYEDYEYSGTDFKRPAYIQMMEDIRNGKINCIIVRDLSRLGREHLEMGRLIDKVFPFLGVRFVSVLDKLDTGNDVDNNKSFEVMIKNIINDLYSKDLSKKVSAAKHQRARDGYFIGSVPPFGYKIDKTPKGQKLIIDENTEAIIKQIFEWTLQGMSQYEVALELNRRKVATPMHYFKTGEMTRANDDYQWHKGTIGKMLRNSAYIGTLTQGQKRQSLIKGVKRHLTSEDQWFVVPNAHEPIITEEEFEIVQKQRKERKENYMFASKPHDFVRDPENRYKGLIFVKESTQALYRRTRIYGKNKARLYYVFQNDVFTGTLNCGERMYIMERDLDEMVSKAVSDLATSLVSEKTIMKDISEVFIQETEKIDSNLKTQKANVQRLNTSIQKLYEKYVVGLLNKEQYLYEKDLENIKLATSVEAIAKLEERLVELKSEKRKARKIARAIFQNRKNTKLSHDVIHELIERIDVISKTEIEIKFAFDFEKEGGFNHE